MHLLELSPPDSGPTALAKLRAEYDRIGGKAPYSIRGGDRVFWDPGVEAALLSEVPTSFAHIVRMIKYLLTRL